MKDVLPVSEIPTWIEENPRAYNNDKIELTMPMINLSCHILCLMGIVDHFI